MFAFKIMFSECAPIMLIVFDATDEGLSDILMGCTSDAVSFINKLLVNPMATADEDVDGIGVDTGLELLLFPPPVELLVADDNELPEATDDGVDDCRC